MKTVASNFLFFLVIEFCTIFAQPGKFLYQLTRRRLAKRELGKVAYSLCRNHLHSDIQLLSLDMGPNPVTIPGRVSVSFDFNVTRPLTNGIEAYIEFKRYLPRIFGWRPSWKIPCLPVSNGHRVGSCYYDDVCGIAQYFLEYNGCKFEKNGAEVPCSCPLTHGMYRITNIMATIPRLSGILASLMTGDYAIKVKLFDRADPETALSCVRIGFTMRQSEDGSTGVTCDNISEGPGQLVHKDANELGPNPFVAGDVAELICPMGYTPSATAVVTCGKNGRWSANPRCEQVDTNVDPARTWDEN